MLLIPSCVVLKFSVIVLSRTEFSLWLFIIVSTSLLTLPYVHLICVYLPLSPMSTSKFYLFNYKTCIILRLVSKDHFSLMWIPFKIYFSLKCNCFPVSCYFLLYSIVNELCVYIYPLPLNPLSYPPPFHSFRSSQSTELISLSYTADFHCLFYIW